MLSMTYNPHLEGLHSEIPRELRRNSASGFRKEVRARAVHLGPISTRFGIRIVGVEEITGGR